jgi:hypothetical protein
MMHTLSRLAAGLAAVLTLAGLAPAQVRTWTQTGSGTFSWNDGANWSGGVFPDGSDDTAVFSGAGAGAAKTVTVAGTITLERLEINATQSNPLTIGGGTLLLSNTGSPGSLNPLVVADSGAPVTHTIDSAIDFDGGTGFRVLNVGSNTTLNLGGLLINGSSAGTYLIAGGGTMVLGGNSPGFASPLVLVGNGTTLAVNGTVGSPVTVGNGTTLTGTGNVNGAVTAQDGGNLAGNPNLGSLDLEAGTVNYTANVGGPPASPVNDRIDIAGALTAQPGTTLNFTLVNDGTLVPGGTYTITLLDAASITGLTAAQITATAANFGFAGTPMATVDGAQGLVNLTFTVVPEPATALAVGAAGLGALWLRRRRAAARA